MYLKKVLIKDFGKFHNKGLELKEGLNIVYGEKESGKTTIKDFILATLFGMSKKKGIGASDDSFERNKPEEGLGYGGLAYIGNDGETYLVEKNFYSSSTQTSVLNVASGRDVRLRIPNTLYGTFTKVDRTTYEGNMCISAPDIEDKAQLAEHIESYITNIVQSGSVNVDRKKAIAYLDNELKKNSAEPLSRRLDILTEKIEAYDDVDPAIEAVEKEIKQLDENFMIEAEKRKRVARKLVENEDGSITYEEDEELEAKINKLSENRKEHMEEDEPAEKPLHERFWFILLVGILGIVGVTILVRLLPFEEIIRRIFILFTAIFVIFTIVDDLRLKGFFKNDDDNETPTDEDFNKVLEELQEEYEQQEEIEFDMTFAKEYQEQKKLLKEKEAALLERRRERSVLKAEFNDVFKKKGALENEIKAINLAKQRINSISESIRKEVNRILFVDTKKYIREMLGPEYLALEPGDEGHLYIKKQSEAIRISELDKGDIIKLYIAIRLSLAKNLIDDEVPLIFDDAFRNLSGKDVIAMCDALSRLDVTQILILTSDDNLKRYVDSAGIANNYQEL